MIIQTPEFISYIQTHGISKANVFDVSINLPNGIHRSRNALVNSKITMGELSVACISTDMPGTNLDVDESIHGGHHYKAAYQRVDTEVDMTFVLSRNMNESYIFSLWHDAIINEGSRDIQYPANYITDITIFNENRATEITLIGAFPSVLSPISLDRSNSDSFNMLTVTFTYKYFKDETKNKPIVPPSRTPMTVRKQNEFVTDVMTSTTVKKLDNMEHQRQEVKEVFKNADKSISGVSGELSNYYRMVKKNVDRITNFSLDKELFSYILEVEKFLIDNTTLTSNDVRVLRQVLNELKLLDKLRTAL